MGRIELVAECSTNHGGSLALAKEFIHRFAEAGADWVKFQHTRVKHLRPDDPQYEWFKQAEFSLEQFAELKAECEKAGTKFLTTVFNHRDVSEVLSLGVDTIKIGSGESGDIALSRAIWDSSLRRVFVSIGAGGPLADWPDWRIVFNATSRYPHPSACAVAKYSDGYLGYSDHSVGPEGCQIALCYGAQIIEKHVCLPNQARPVRSWEATIEEFKAIRAFADEDPSRMIGRWQYGD